MLRKILGAKKEEAIEGWSKLHNKELRNLRSSPDISTVTESKRLRWAGYVARIGK